MALCQKDQKDNSQQVSKGEDEGKRTEGLNVLWHYYETVKYYI